jgi:hypothetical protein
MKSVEINEQQVPHVRDAVVNVLEDRAEQIVELTTSNVRDTKASVILSILDSVEILNRLLTKLKFGFAPAALTLDLQDVEFDILRAAILRKIDLEEADLTEDDSHLGLPDPDSALSRQILDEVLPLKEHLTALA